MTLDPSHPDHYSRTRRDREDEEARFYIGPERARAILALEAYLETIAIHEGFACPLGQIAAYDQDEALEALMGYLRTWEGDYVRKEVLPRESE